MPNLKVIAAVLSSFLAGIAFVVACDGDDIPLIDAGKADAASCDCEPPITADRIYHVRVEGTDSFDIEGSGERAVFVEAACNEGDIFLSGGCWALDPEAFAAGQLARGQSPVTAFGPLPPVGGNPGTPNKFKCAPSVIG
jgi:hypothetical protein